MNYNERKFISAAKNPDLIWFDSPMEDFLYKEFKTFGISPVIQHPVGKYFIDFAFPKEKIAVEYDGRDSHANKEVEDKEKDDFLISSGWKVIRISKDENFWNCGGCAFGKFQSVLEYVKNEILKTRDEIKQRLEQEQRDRVNDLANIAFKKFGI